MQELKVLGKEKVADFEFTGIEGGFGEDKKAMLVKDIAKIHGRQTYKVNELINNNKKQFIDGLDIIDLLNVSEPLKKSVILQKDNKTEVLLRDLGFTQGSINRSSHIYLLSERGYLKLLKIMDDDKAWGIYTEIVDNYFNMRVAIKEGKPKLVDKDRLEIMAKNASTRRAKALMQLVETAPDYNMKKLAWRKAYEELSGEKFGPDTKRKQYTATFIAKQIGTTPMMVGKIANMLGLKAEKPHENKYGRWERQKARYSGKQVLAWVYWEAGRKAILKEFFGRED